MKAMKRTLIAALILATLTWSQVGHGQDRPRRGGSKPRPEPTVDWTKIEDRIAWYGTLELGRAAAVKTGRPILLISGAPHCSAVPGVW